MSLEQNDTPSDNSTSTDRPQLTAAEIKAARLAAATAKAEQGERENRVAKMQKLLDERGELAYKNKFARTHKIIEARNAELGTKMRVCGRLVAKRIMGKLIFADLYDIDGRIQVKIVRDTNPEAHAYFKSYLDLGDYVGAGGELIQTPAGELTVEVADNDLVLLSKALRPLPEHFHGLNDVETRYRQRYLDIIANDETRKVFRTRLKTLELIRRFLVDNGFTEVETPILQSVACGANARPFITKHNSLDIELFLRIAPELYLKQVVECGFDRVFELGKNFRNEGMDAAHLQEFTMLEWYASYWDFNDNIEFIQKLFRYIITEINGEPKLTYQGQEFDFSNVARLNYTEEINKCLGINVLDVESVDQLKAHVLANKIISAEDLALLTSVTAIVDYMFKKAIRPKLIQPTITFNYPAFMIPLARRNDEDPRLIDMFQFIVNGWEIVKAYSELVNPITQLATFEEQMEARKAGDEEAMSIDTSFVRAMEHGMPPMSGLGLGIDRFISLLTDQPTLRDVVLFPTMR